MAGAWRMFGSINSRDCGTDAHYWPPPAHSPEVWNAAALPLRVSSTIGYYNSTLTTLASDFNHLAKKRTIHDIFVDPLLAYTQI
jgi:hypothetical protein